MVTNVCQALWIVRAIFVGLDSEDLESLAEYAGQDPEINEESANWLLGMIGMELQARNTRNNQSPRF